MGDEVIKVLEHYYMEDDMAAIEMEGSVDGVTVAAVEGGFEVAFEMDRHLVNMMHKVPGAAFDKAEKVWVVPEASADELAKAVKGMRYEFKEIQKDRESIMALAKSSAIGLQRENGTAQGVAPMVSDYREAGKSYGGEIIRANGRFVAQFTGFGERDGAAFVTVHRTVELNRQLEKGENVWIKYNDKGLGEVSDRRSKESRIQEFQASDGKTINGVTVTDRGDKLGVAFEVNPALQERIKRIDGAEFNHEDKVWEVSTDKAEFVMRAVEDMRQVYEEQQREASLLSEFAEERMDGAKVRPAFTQDGTEHFGKIAKVGNHFLLQKGALNEFKLHHLDALNEPEKMQEGQNLSIKYNKGRGTAVDLDKKREKDALSR